MPYLLNTPHNIHWHTSPGALAHHTLDEQKYQTPDNQHMDQRTVGRMVGNKEGKMVGRKVENKEK
jgi:hypothetical protein